MSVYFDRQGNPIDSMLEHSNLFSDENYRNVGFTPLSNGKLIVTIWTGTDWDNNTGTEPLIFETVVFDKYGQTTIIGKWATEKEAKTMHERTITAHAG
ncbi:hypothetical protein [Brevibacillus laterosporus]|uniref:hypothetical protein n=1 Tax=Brevibacillus laterosporus TaxID=1465 RepID=UPI003D1E4003